jgi:hypothetical protein
VGRPVAVVQGVAVVEDEEGPSAGPREVLDQAVVGGEVVDAFFALDAAPEQVHPRPPETRLTEPLHLAGLRVGEVDVHPEAFGHGGRRELGSRG